MAGDAEYGFLVLPADKYMTRGERMLDVHAIDQLAQRLQSVLPPGLAQAHEDLQANMRDVLAEGLKRMDLVTREEFDVQRALLERTRHRLEALEWRIATLESAGQRPRR